LHLQSLRAIAERSSGVFRASLEIALVVVLAIQAARLVWIIAEPVGPFGSPPAADTNALSDQELAILKTFNPFAPRVPATTAVKTADGLALFGVRVGNDGTGSAIIASSGKQSVYWVGEQISPGTVLKELAADHVLLAHGARTSRLDLVARAAPPVSSASVPPYIVASRPAPSGKAPVVASVDTRKLLDEAGLRPRTQDGQVTGYTLLPRGAGEMLGRAGLAAGDVLVALNGNRLTPERYSEIEQELTGASQVQLTVERGNQTRTITLQTGR
jgi:general secretion pathway protein C